MFDLISIGNISIDLFFKGDSLTFSDNRFQLAIGGKYFVDTFHQGTGGGGANVAIGALKNGAKTAVLGKIGNNAFRKIILDDLHTAGVDTTLCQYEDDYLNLSSILLSPSGERSIVNFDTPHQHILNNNADLKHLCKTKMVYFGNLPDVSLTEREKIIRYLHEEWVRVAVNLGVKDCRRPLEQLIKYMKPVDILLLNGYEYAEFIKQDYTTLDFTHKKTYALPWLKDKIIIVTDGSKGSYGYNGTDIVYQEAISVKHIVDTTGAGDGYVSAFLAHYIKTGNIASSMKKGAHYASHILTKVGAN